MMKTKSSSYLHIALSLAVCLVLVAMSAGEVRASALLLQEFSAETAGQAHAVTAGGRHPSTQVANASNLSYIDGFDFQFGFTLYLAQSTYTNTLGEKTETEMKPTPAPHVFISLRTSDWLTIGLAIFPNYGMSLNWPDDWEGNMHVIDNSLESVTINPNFSFGPFKGFSIAMGVDIVWSRFNLTRAVPLGFRPEGDEDAKNTMHLLGEGLAFGGNLGMSYQPVDWVRVGFAFRSGYEIKVDGDMDFDVASMFDWRLPDQEYRMSIQTPHQISFGARFWPLENLSLELDGYYFTWSDYKERRVDLVTGVYEGPEKLRMEDTTEINMKDNFMIALGAEYDPIEHLVVRLGAGFDSNSSPEEATDPIQPDGHRINIGTSIGTEWYGFYADMAYMFTYMIPTDLSENATMPGEFQTFKHSVILSFGYHFDPFVKDAPAESEDEQPEPEVEEAPAELETRPPEVEETPVEIEPAPAPNA